MLKILLYGLNYSPEMTGVGKYSGEMGAWLSERGHEVRVVCAPPYYPSWKLQPEYRGLRYRLEHGPEGTRIYRCPIYIPRNASGLQRLIHLSSFAFSSLPALLTQVNWSPDVILLVEPTFFCAPGALLLGAITQAPCWLHVQDFEVDAAFGLDLLPAGGVLQRFVTALEHALLRRFSRVSSISTNMVACAQRKGVPAERSVLFPNWVDENAIQPLPGPSELRRHLHLEDKIVVLYSGNLGNKQGLQILEPLCEHFQRDPRVQFLVCGDGPFRPFLEDLVGRYKNMILRSLFPEEHFNDLLNTADIHLLPQREGAADLVMPSKLSGMLASGRPVVGTAAPNTQIAEILRGDPGKGISPAGVVVPPGNTAALVEALAALVEDSRLRLELGIAARTVALKHFRKQVVLKRFEENLKVFCRER